MTNLCEKFDSIDVRFNQNEYDVQRLFTLTRKIHENEQELSKVRKDNLKINQQLFKMYKGIPEIKQEDETSISLFFWFNNKKYKVIANQSLLSKQ